MQIWGTVWRKAGKYWNSTNQVSETLPHAFAWLVCSLLFYWTQQQQTFHQIILHHLWVRIKHKTSLVAAIFVARSQEKTKTKQLVHELLSLIKCSHTFITTLTILNTFPRRSNRKEPLSSTSQALRPCDSLHITGGQRAICIGNRKSFKK